MKKQILLLLSFSLLLSSLAVAAPKIATFNIAEIVKSSSQNKRTIEAFEAAKQELAQNPRKLAIDAMVVKIQALQDKINTTEKDSDEYAKAIQETEAAANGYNDLLNEWTNYQKSEQRTLTQNLIDALSKHNNEILNIARSIGESGGFDWILEMSGKTNSNTPPALYIRNSTDITDQVIAELEKSTPASE